MAACLHHPAPGARVDDFVVTRVLRRAHGRGCAVARSTDGRGVFVRWADPVAAPSSADGVASEVRVLSQVADPRTPRPLGLFTEHGLVFSATSLLPGRCIRERPRVSALLVAEKLFSLLASLHRQGVGHGDISPDNVLVRPDGEVSLVDWELAGKFGDATAPGTLGYTPPAAWIGKSYLAPERDLYAASVTLLEFATGETLFHGSRDEITAKQTSWSAADEIPKYLPKSLADLLIAAFNGVNLLTHKASPRVDSQRLREAVCLEEARRIAGILRAGGDLPDGALAMDVPAPLLRSAACAMVAQLGAINCPGGAHGHAARLRVALSEVCEGDWSNLAPCEKSVDSETTSSPESAFADVRPDRSSVVIVTLRCVESPMIGAASAAPAQSAGCAFQWQVRLVARPVTGSPAERAQYAALMRLTQGMAAADVAVAPPGWRACNLEALFASAVRGNMLFTDDTDLTHTPGRGAPARTTDIVRSPTLAPLRAAQVAAEGGNATMAFRLLVRTSTAAIEHAADAQTWNEIAGAWASIGMHGVSLAALEYVAAGHRCGRWWWRRLRGLNAERRAAELERALSAAVTPMLEAGLECEVFRFRAVSELRRRNAQAALRLMRAVPRSQLHTAELGTLHVVTLGNTLRLAGRTHSARRVLRIAVGLARVSGCPRLKYTSRFNLLLATAESGSEIAAASAFGELAASAASEGLCREAAEAGTRAAALAISARTLPLARDSLRVAERAASIACGVDGRQREQIQTLRAQLATADGDFMHLTATSPAATTEARILASVARLEISESDVRGPSTATCVGRTDPYRLLLLALRAATRGRRAMLAVQLVHRFLVLRRDDILLCSAVVRIIVARTESASDCLDYVRRHIAQESEFREVAVVAHAVHLSRSRGTSREAASWMYQQLEEAERDRPLVVRKWEWSVATLWCEWELFGRAPKSSDVQAIRNEVRLLLPMIPSTSQLDYYDRALSARLELLTAASQGDRSARTEFGWIMPLFLRSAQQSLDHTMDDLISALLRVVRAERIVLLLEPDGGSPRARVGGITALAESTEIEVCHSVLAASDARGGSILIDDATADPVLASSPSVRLFRPRSVGVVPLSLNGKQLGYVYMENRTRGRGLTSADVEAVSRTSESIAAILLSAHDRDELRRKSTELRGVREELIRAKGLEAIGRSSSEVIHEVRNYLTAVLGESDLALTGADSADACRESLSIIRRAANDAVAVLGRLQESVRTLSEEDMSDIDLLEVIREVLLVSRSRLAQSGGGAGVAVRLAGMPGSVVRGIPSELREVVSNLVGNSLDAMSSGGTLAVEVSQSDGFAVITVSDTGCGMPPEVAARVFEPFFSTKGSRGNGLGLSIVEAIVRRHRGEVTVQSLLGQGTTFTVRLPAVGGAHSRARPVAETSLATG